VTSPPKLAALRSHDFRLLFFGQLVSLTGSQMQQVAVAWQIYTLTHSALALGLLGACRALPMVLFALPGGLTADRLDRRRVMLVSQSLMALASVLLALLTASQRITPTAIYAVMCLASVGLALDAPARQALLPNLVPRAHLANALSLHATAWEFAAVGGPALAGLIISWRGVVPIYVADAASFFAVIGALLAMEHRAPPARATVGLESLLEPFRFLLGTPIILTTMLLDFFATFFAGAMNLMPIFADQILGVGPRGLSLLYPSQPVGALVAAALLSFLPTIHRQGLTVLVAVAVYGASIAAFGASRWLPLSMLLLAISGAADTVSMVVRQTLRQMLTPDHLRGRMTSVNMVFFIGGPQLGEVEAGLVARLAGPRISVASGGVLCMIAAAAAALFVPSLRGLTAADYRAREPK
jgi:MFS family permease